jgi:UDP-N-acetylglucosamine:LPS N-acetylglucosamine transferase
MLNTTRFLLTEKEAGVAASDAPSMLRIRQQFPRPVEQDIEGAVRRELEPLLAKVQAGQRIAVTGSSRGISNFARVIRECVAALKARGA